LRAYK